MIKQNIFRIVLFFSFPSILWAQEPDPFFTDKMAQQESSRFLKKTAFAETESYADYDLIYQRMEWEVDPAVSFISGEITSYFKSQQTNLTEIEFDLHAEMIVDSITQKGQPINFSRNKNRISIQLHETLSKGQTDSLSVFYQGEPPSTGFGSFTIGTHNQTPVLWTLSEPYGAMEWWPCKQSLADKIDSIDVIVTTPEPYRTASNGILVSEKVTAGKRTMHWKHRYPIATYLVAIAVTNYADYSDSLATEDGREIEILNFVYPENEAKAKTETPVTAEIMALFNELIGEYPFANEKYGHAQFGWGGGMEHQTMSFMGSFGFELVAHELAHQWFGNYITLGSWQDIWLNEGFATYLSGLTYENMLDGVWWPRWKRLNHNRITSEPGGSVFVEDTTSVSRTFSSRLSYSKGAYLLHMLRWVLGDEPFFNAIRNYFSDPEVANGFARTSQLIKHFETAGDTTLSEFFNDWFYGEGFPVYSAEFSQTDAQNLQITLSQTPSHNSVDFFEMPVPVRVYNTQKTDSANFRIMHTENNQQFQVQPGFIVSEIKIDPDYWLISQTAEVVNLQLTENPETIIVSPNPFVNEVSIILNGNQSILKTRIFSAAGKLLNQFDENQTTLNLSNLSQGIYILKIETSEKTTERIIVKY
ncbi:Por secretion system C-terminal sorting domain-containing protein [Tangfeifania diversioriginum]|uniref:Aminopeptidase N n=1 Tax=Tangfeifania diversioriginum TaxID=1168035 RepID=A0A1M6HQI0_9BACT|nr:M1 family aminopeptidase [Tangfeifania diversioriginum]SHJ24344.1 Por secretion system C-terminal sorting domain-containing protein [Tangfeifania diversioriginum]